MLTAGITRCIILIRVGIAVTRMQPRDSQREVIVLLISLRSMWLMRLHSIRSMV